MTTGQHIKKRREELNISQTELANRVKISKQTLYKYEHDIVTNIPYDTVVALADALDCTGAHLLGWEDPVDEETAKNNRALIKSYEHKAIVESMTDLDFDVIHSFMYASPDIKAAVMKLLDIYT